MRNINWGNVTASADGDFQRLPAGPYVAKIVSMENNARREYVEPVFDIAEGEYAGFYSDAWGVSHPYAHHLFLSYKDTALGMLKGRLEAIQESNPGFDPFAAWDAERWDMFTGRLLGVNLQEEEYRKGDGTIATLNDGTRATRLNVCQVVPAAKVRDGEIKPRPRKTVNDGTPEEPVGSMTLTPGTPGVAAPADAYAGTIPFS